mmetsp:Transcript_10155/g.8693  ORF Transcript_10155/g.8693 Transcript_10155/m.8693 type:complete len:88 (+) Transcript_10155:3702-3965(+)
MTLSVSESFIDSGANSFVKSPTKKTMTGSAHPDTIVKTIPKITKNRSHRFAYRNNLKIEMAFNLEASFGFSLYLASSFGVGFEGETY